ncbi:MAG: protein phosphatase 2C domain-containing protein [Bdellovibrionota bacterium]|nr:MAG: protein phosphatase 2C domain-containing protein [Bdellovibrionota bacterium]
MLVPRAEQHNLGATEVQDETGLVPAAITDTGCERDLNEDRYAVIECPSGLAWLVCDGMGGTAGGELAAQLAIDAIRRDLENLPARLPEQAFRDAVREANRIIVLRRQNQAFSGMGTTIVGALFQGPQVIIANAGDSRAYLVRNGAIQQLTTDHTYVQELVDRGQVRAEDALAHPQAHILTKCIGSEPSLEVEIHKYWLWDEGAGAGASDTLVLCSDGLYSLVSEVEVAEAVASYSPQRACVRLVELAKERGGFDNITLAVIPLGGELRAEPPSGVNEQQLLRQLVSAQRKPGNARATLIRNFLLVFMLSSLAVLLTVLVMALTISR